MAFGGGTISLFFNGKQIEQVDRYKYLGTIIRSVKMANQDIFIANYAYLCDQARKAIFGAQRKIKGFGVTPPHIKLYLFDSLIKPILTYGSEVWRVSKMGQDQIDKVFLRYARHAIGVKPNTSSLMVLGEVGYHPPSVYCMISLMCFVNRLHHLPSDTIAKTMFSDLKNLNDLGFRSWVSFAMESIQSHDLDLDLSPNDFKRACKTKLMETCVNQRHGDICDVAAHPILRTYNTFKSSFVYEPYLLSVKNHKYRNAITRLRTSSHRLEIEIGRHHKPKIPVKDRLCHMCGVVEDEYHFVMFCKINIFERALLMSKIRNIIPIQTCSYNEIFRYIMSTNEPYVSSLFGKFVHNSFEKRSCLLTDYGCLLKAGSYLQLNACILYFHNIT